ncbi:PstS family phosphate ABC transporter substrate-binding protein [Arsenicibacter rosenii]|uniref:Phosphate ABC transporter substrate-binding protein n=1 Tax=Arsenicibacter rosenii TaxID=1750698 RepID=A0A1S2VF27_9BACT|nr:substrate-binding domain-containing protein [Arsenicibacter rosenii]OIN56895.1 phosphate ABC transporter substrate-binding protein [Arsenicibacter rosenii]
MKNGLKGACLALLMGGISGCSGDKPLDSPSRGTITVAVDESFKPLAMQLTDAYSGIYPDTHFELKYRPERESIAMLLKDSARLAFTTRPLTRQEQIAFDQQKIIGKAEKIGTDGVALIVSKNNRDSLITMAELKAVFSGQLTQWQQLKGATETGPITLVFDNNNSSNLDFVLRTFSITDVSKLRIFTTHSNKEVIEYVRKNPTALGFIGVNWISDGDSPLSGELSADMRVLGVSDKDNPTSIKDYYQPFQRNLGLQTYPLRRPVYILSRETHPGLGGGLINYIARDAGSLLIEKLGLWPVKPYNREVYIRK